MDSNKLVLKVGELFSGAGGLGLGFIIASHPQVSYQTSFALDNDFQSLLTYRSNLDWLTNNTDIQNQLPLILEMDVNDFKANNFSSVVNNLDLLIGGSPCQGYSSANRASNIEKKQKQNSLVKSFFDQVEQISPKMFLIENVQGVGWTELTDEMSNDPRLDISQDKNFRSVKKYFASVSRKLGYHVWNGLVNAVDYGVPQTRIRFVMFGVKQNLLTSEEDINLEPYLSKYKSEPVSVSEAIGDLPVLENGTFWSLGDYHPSNKIFVNKMRQFMPNGDLHDHFTTKHADYVIERYKKIPQGGNWKSIRSDMSNYSNPERTHSNIYRRLQESQPAHTISNYRKTMTIHPTQDRGLSMREACRLQSFPDWFRFQGTLNDKQQQLANAVPPILASALAKAIADFWLQHISANIKKTITSRAEWNFTQGL